HCGFRRLVMLIVLAFFASGCSGTGRLNIPDPMPDDQRDIPPPKKRKIYEEEDGFDQQVARQFEQAFDFSRHIRWLTGRPKQAYNVDAFDEVANSSWFTNRNGRRPMTLEEIKRGPNTGDGPAILNGWTVVAAKPGGVTHGFTIEDSRGDRYLLKFDPQGYSELATGAEVVSTKLFYAAGYNTPENYIVEFQPDILTLAENVVIKDKSGKKRIMTRADLDNILSRIARRPDGTVRAMASKILEGKIVGPFRYYKTRKDDPNDIIPHEHRRELRSVSVISAWLNNYDTKANNTLDVYVNESGRRYVKHYLIDFGSTLGSRGNMPMPFWVGYEHTYDPAQVLKNTVGLGLYVPRWEKDREIEFASIGRFDANNFRPDKYKFVTPNMAFENLTDRDGFWAAKIVMSFTEDQLRAAVESGQYTDPEAADYLVETLVARRDITGRYWFDKINPLDRFEIRNSTDGKQEFVCADLAVEFGLEDRGQSTYRFEFRTDGKPQGEPIEVEGTPRIAVPPFGDEVIEVRIRTRRGESRKWSKYVSAFIARDDNPAGLSVIAIERQE
ncbi:MAG: hypothetical protein JSW58_12495, partial [Candidatus Latescibacterota bacterium]